MNRRTFLAALAAVFAWRKAACRTFIAPRYFTAPPMLGLGSLFNPKEDLAALWVKTPMPFVPYDSDDSDNQTGAASVDNSADDEALLKEIRNRFDYASERWRKIREERQIDVRYVCGNPWTEDEIPARWQAEELWTMTPRGMVNSTGSARRAAAAASTSRSPAL